MDALPSRFINEIPDNSVEKNETDISTTDDFEFNQDNTIEFDESYRSPGWDRYKKNKMLKWKKIKKLKYSFQKEQIDGYIIPKNDEFFGEYIPNYNDRLNFISNFTGSYGFSLILKKDNFYLLMDDILYKPQKSVGNFLKLLLFQKNAL